MALKRCGILVEGFFKTWLNIQMRHKEKKIALVDENDVHVESKVEFNGLNMEMRAQFFSLVWQPWENANTIWRMWTIS